MTIDQINEFINRGGAALALVMILAVLVFHVFRKDVEKLTRRK